VTSVLLAERPRGVLALGAHPDDVEIGCGGTLLQLAARYPGLPVTVIVFTGSAERHAESQMACDLFLPTCAVSLHTFGLPDGRLPAHWGEVKQRLEDLATGLELDVILAPSPYDAHQDHRLLAELVPTVWRRPLALGYEIPKYDGDFGRPNVYVPMSEEIARTKVDLLSKAYQSQIDRDWWDEETFLGLARLRGMECRSRYAEAFTANKVTLTW
jgi:LmbE family N-acetylglucosaminyl deacetylase